MILYDFDYDFIFNFTMTLLGKRQTFFAWNFHCSLFVEQTSVHKRHVKILRNIILYQIIIL